MANYYQDLQEYTNKYHLPKHLLASVIGFNGSKNADKTSPQNFYTSYIETKKSARKRTFYHKDLTDLAEENKDKVLNLIKELF